MSRPLRLEFAGALYHVTSRGNERKAIYKNDADFELFLDVLGEVCSRYNWVIHAYCLMPNHYHLLLETPDANLSKGMRQLNGVYTQKFNRKYKRVGHLYQGRYKAILVDKDAYLLELSRYIVLNPVRAKRMNIDSPEDWLWSSYNTTVGLNTAVPEWLAVSSLLQCFSKKKKMAIKQYIEFVAQGRGIKVWDKLTSQVFLGSEEFVESHQKLIDDKNLQEVPFKQTRPRAEPLSYFYKLHNDSPKKGMVEAYLSGGYSMAEIAKVFKVHYSTVSRAVARCKT